MKGKFKKEFIEWVVILTVIGIIYFGGWHVEIIGSIQQAVLSTGIISPDRVDEKIPTSYDFKIEDMKGKIIDFSTFKGNVIFLNFWATWCPPCIAEMPDIHSLYEEKKESVAFIMVSLDKDRQKVEHFLKRKGFEFPVYFLESRLPNIYTIHSIPTTYIIDKEGYIQVKNHGMAKYKTNYIETLLSELSEPKKPV